MAKNLVIVESPAKAKTIEGFLGKDFEVKSSFGHVRDLKKKGLGIDVENQFAPHYEISPDKKSVVADLKKSSKKADLVWLASDEDREGEAIAWHLFEVLGLKKEKTKRIVFNEITKTAILSAVENPREINIDLVEAQQARRILDRLVGFELSPILWRKIKPSLSAGRVQSVAVRLIVEREKDIENFKSVSSYKVVASFAVNGNKTLKAELDIKYSTKEEAIKFLESCLSAKYTIDDLQVKPAKKSPTAPFTTSTLQQEASRKLGFSVSRTMVVAQRLYESGKITYMRTDSVNLSKQALEGIKNEIIANYGAEYANPKQYVTNAKGAQEAHEAIRPTNVNVKETGEDRDEQRLYDLIWKRTVSSQMADAQLEKTTIKVKVSNESPFFIAKGEVIKFDGFLKVYLESKEDEDEEKEAGLLPPVVVGQELTYENIEATERFTHHPARFSEASLVKQLEDRGIGRPSTYAPTISTIQKRGYIVKEEREGKERKYTALSLSNGKISELSKTEITGKEKGKLYPTDIGIVVNDFLVDHFSRIMDYSFTASVEKEFDQIAVGDVSWNKMIGDFYSPFHENVEYTMEHSERASGERNLGIDPKSGDPVIARIGRFGPMVQIGGGDTDIKPRFASLRKNMTLASVTLEEALELFKLPREVGEYEGKKVSTAIGRFGPYIRFDKLFVSIPKEEDPLSIDLNTCIELIELKKKAEKEKYIKTFEEDESVQVLKGRYGPYIKIGKDNFKIPKGVEPADLTLEDCKKIAEEAPKKGSKRGKSKKTK